MSKKKKSHHCGRFVETSLSRRQMLSRCASGFGGLVLADLLGGRREALAHDKGRAVLRGGPSPLTAQYPPKARSVIFLYMDGGPSQVDTFDYKPALEKYAGRSPYDVIGRVEDTQFDNIGKILPSPWKFRQYGESGTWVSDLFPHVAQCVDEIAVIRSMKATFPEHTAANYFLHTGHGIQGRPSMGAWMGYGLGSWNDSLPAFVVLNGGLVPPGGLDNFNSGFLPATFQGSVFKAGETPVANVSPIEDNEKLQVQKLDFIHALDRAASAEMGSPDAVESAIANYEMAYRMQSAVPELMALEGESDAIRKLYGVDAEYGPTQIFARQCLTARRLVERGVRFIELTCPHNGSDRWDQHGNLTRDHGNNARAVDQPIAALLKDLKCRGLLDETLILWGGEFGRTPFAQGSDGRDHNPYGFTMWMAGGGVQGGLTYGSTDEFGYKTIAEKVEVHDIHATMLHLMGIDHETLTYRFSGRDIRLTDVYGRVLHDILA